jgi:hypothetical protein
LADAKRGVKLVPSCSARARQQFSLRTLLIVTTVGPPILAAGFWTGQWLLGNYMFALALLAVALYMGVWIIGPLAWYFEIIEMICGSNSTRHSRRRRHCRVRIERYCVGYT